MKHPVTPDAVTSAATVKKAVKKVGNARKKVEKRLVR
jgi:Protein of unknown function (DUF3606)